MTTDSDNQKVQTETEQSAIDGDVRERCGDLIDTTTKSLCKYVNNVAGGQVVAEPDNEIRRIMTGLVSACEERAKNAS